MRIDRHFFQLLGVALALTVAACSGDRLQPTAAVSADTELSTLQLNATADAERARTARAALASQPAFDSLIASWSSAIGISDVLNVTSLTLLRCRPLPYASDVRVVGPAGGRLRIGPHTLTIPAGALSNRVVITGEAPVSELAQVRFSPHGLTFNERYPARLTLSYDHCDSRLGLNLPKRIVYVDDLLQILEVLPSLNDDDDDDDDEKTTAPINHFSSYVVAY